MAHSVPPQPRPSPASGSHQHHSWSVPASSGMRTSGTNTPTADTYLMPTSPAKRGRGSDASGSKPRIYKTTGQKPACLVNASVTYCGNDQIYAFGGFDQFTDEVYNHVLRLNLKTLDWALVDNYGDIPGVRMGHSASLYQGDKLLVYGGENEHREYLSDLVILNLTDHHWTQPEITGPIPKGRARHAAVVYEDKLFIIGGLTGETQYILDDICYLDLKTWTWSRTWSFVQRFDHTAWIWGGRLWVLGGMGHEMERTTEIWWLDLKGSPTLGLGQNMGRRGVSMARLPTPRQDQYMGHGRSDRTDTYAANSGSVHIRSSRRERPTAPGAISSLKFLSGPHVPAQSSGTHFHVCTSGSLIDLVSPAATIRHVDCSLSSLELDSLRWQRIVEGSEVFHPGYKWHYCTINEEGTKIWLLGSPADDANNGNQEQQLSDVLSIDLRRYGFLGNETRPYSEQARLLAAERSLPTPSSFGLGADLAAMFDQTPESGSMTDFVITANADSGDDCETRNSTPEPDSFHTQTRFSTSSTSSQVYLSQDTTTSPPIHTHKMILHARWPHFKRLYASKMIEYQTNKLHIPEPYSVVRAFLYYIYTDSIAPHPEYCRSLTDVAGMLVMANLYDMPKLRLLCVNRLSREIDIDHAAVIWERAGRTDEEWLKQRAARFCMMNWGRVVRTEALRSLSRQSLIELLEVVDMEGRVVGGEELEVDGFGIGAMGGRRRHRASETEGETDGGEEEDGMDIN